jgi:hypothetical protein
MTVEAGAAGSRVGPVVDAALNLKMGGICLIVGAVVFQTTLNSEEPQSGPRRRLTRNLQAVLPLTLALYLAQYLYSVLKAGVKAVEWDRTTAPRLGRRLAATPCHLTRPSAS